MLVWLLYTLAAIGTGLWGADDWQAREAGSRLVTALGDAALPAVHAAARSDDPELVRRAGFALSEARDRQYERSVEELRMQLIGRDYPDWPWIDSLPVDGTVGLPWENMQSWLKYAESQGHKRVGPDWPAYRMATRYFVEANIGGAQTDDGNWHPFKETDPAKRAALMQDLSVMLAKMVEGDRQKCRGGNHRWIGPGKP